MWSDAGPITRQVFAALSAAVLVILLVRERREIRRFREAPPDVATPLAPHLVTATSRGGQRRRKVLYPSVEELAEQIVQELRRNGGSCVDRALRACMVDRYRQPLASRRRTERWYVELVNRFRWAIVLLLRNDEIERRESSGQVAYVALPHPPVDVVVRRRSAWVEIVEQERARS